MKMRKEWWYVVALVVLIIILMVAFRDNLGLSPRQKPTSTISVNSELQKWVENNFATDKTNKNTNNILRMLQKAAGDKK